MTGETPCVIVISGLPGSGKTTTAHALAQRFERAAHVEADQCHLMIESGRVSPTGLAKPAAGSASDMQLRLRLEQACLLARSFVEAGFTAILDEIVIGDRLHEMKRHLQGLDVRFVMLSPTFAHVRERWLAIDSPFADAWDWIEEERQRTDRVGLWLDTTALTVDQVTDEIHRRLDNGIITT